MAKQKTTPEKIDRIVVIVLFIVLLASIGILIYKTSIAPSRTRAPRYIPEIEHEHESEGVE